VLNPVDPLNPQELPRRTIAAFALALLACAGFTAPMQAQGVSLASAESTARVVTAPRGMLPISSTTVMHYVLEPDSSGGARVGFVLLVRGEPGWWRRPTGSGTDRPAPDLEMQQWTIGETQYSIGYSARYRRLHTFGRLFNLGGAPVILVTLGGDAETPALIRAGDLTTFVLRAGESAREFPSRFLAESPDAREFAGIP
jgi:hypothetical protein